MSSNFILSSLSTLFIIGNLYPKVNAISLALNHTISFSSIIIFISLFSNFIVFFSKFLTLVHFLYKKINLYYNIMNKKEYYASASCL